MPGAAGAPDVTLSIFTRHDHEAGGPAIYHIHGGGMVMGDRFLAADEYLDWVVGFDAVVVSVEYRLAPENPDPAPIEDCYAGLSWMVAHSDDLGIDASRVVVAGGSAGGGLAAGLALVCRDIGGPALSGQLLIYPMLDDRNCSVSSHQVNDVGVWDRASNDTGWDALLGDRRGTDDVSVYAAPARARDLSRLPSTFIDAGSVEVFRDEVVDYALRIWKQGGIAELHVWPGAYHGFDALAPHARVSVEARAARVNWLRRVFVESQ